MQNESTLISVEVDDDRERQTADRTFSVTFSSVPSGAVFSSPALTFTIPPNDLVVRLDSMGPFKFEKGTVALKFTVDGLQNSKTFAVSSTDARVAVQTGLITVDEDPFYFFDVTLSLTQGAELEIKETINLEISHLDALKPSARDSAQISAGASHTCGIRDGNTVACWGSRSDGQTDPASNPEISQAEKFLAVSAGASHTCGIRIDNTAACWGDNSSGQSTPPSGPFLAVSAGDGYTCGIQIDNTAACWGDNSSGQSTPPSGPFLAVSAGGFSVTHHSCGIRIDNTLACWGDNSDGQSTPPSGPFLAISVGGFHTCGIQIDNTAACWGRNTSKQGDLMDTSQGNVSNAKFLTVSAGGFHTCGILMDGSTVACWGLNSLNQSSPTSSTDPDQGGPVDESDEFLAVSAGTAYTCAIRIDGTTACWGRQDNNRSIPPDDFRARIIPDTFYLLEKQDMNVPLEIQSAVRLRIRVFLEGALR